MNGAATITPAEHFDDIGQQRDAAKLGMWIFLATEVMFFGGLFLAYTVYRYTYGQVFAQASRHLDDVVGGMNTAVLLFGSLLMALAVRATEFGQKKLLVRLLLATAFFGFVFMAMKGFEYHKDFVECLIPGMNFQWDGPDARNAELFFWIYFGMTGLHAIHVVVGIGLLIVFALLARRDKFPAGIMCRSKYSVSIGTSSTSFGYFSFRCSIWRVTDENDDIFSSRLLENIRCSGGAARTHMVDRLCRSWLV